MPGETPKPEMMIFRFADARSLEEEGMMTTMPIDPKVLEWADQAIGAGLMEGENVRVLFRMPGLSLTHAWFGKDFPLPLHSHDADCLYYIVAGSIRMGTQELGKGDGFFLPADMPYTYRPGPDGVELLEIRQTEAFNYRNFANGEAFWKRATKTSADNREEWTQAAV